MFVHGRPVYISPTLHETETEPQWFSHHAINYVTWNTDYH